MASGTRLKVKVADLLARVRAKQTEADAQYTRDLAKYEKQRDKARAAVKARLIKAVEEADEKDFGTGYRSISIPYSGLNTPSKPSKPSFSKEISLLEMAAEEFIVVTTDSQWSRFL